MSFSCLDFHHLQVVKDPNPGRSRGVPPKLRAIAASFLSRHQERLRQQEEEEKLRKETEEERLKTAQKKRKYLRDQWLSEATSPSIFTRDSSWTSSLQHNKADEDTAAEKNKSQKTPQDKEEEAADARKEEQASLEENKESVHCAATARTHNPYQAATEEDVRVNKEAEDYCSIQMEKRMFHESGQEGRSVLGMLAVQVERDPKTGATVVRSVAPVSTPAGAARDNTVFDDGRKSIHTVGGSGGQPSTEELGQILSVIDGVGMEALLDEVTVMPIEADNVEASGPLKENLSLSTHQATSNGKNILLDSSRRYDLEAELSIEDNAVSVGNEKDKKDDTSIMVVRDMVVDNVEVQRLEEGPVTLLFLGYTDATPDPGSGQEGDEGMITVERVIITEDGEEYVVGPETSASPPSTSNKEPEQEAGKESQEVFQDIPLDGARVKVQGEEGDKGLHKSSSPSVAAAEGTSKRKTCQCCSVM